MLGRGYVLDMFWICSGYVLTIEPRVLDARCEINREKGDAMIQPEQWEERS